MNASSCNGTNPYSYCVFIFSRDPTGVGDFVDVVLLVEFTIIIVVLIIHYNRKINSNTAFTVFPLYFAAMLCTNHFIYFYVLILQFGSSQKFCFSCFIPLHLLQETLVSHPICTLSVSLPVCHGLCGTICMQMTVRGMFLLVFWYFCFKKVLDVLPSKDQLLPHLY